MGKAGIHCIPCFHSNAIGSHIALAMSFSNLCTFSLSFCVSLLCFVIVAVRGLIIVLVFGKLIVIPFNPEGRQELLKYQFAFGSVGVLELFWFGCAF